MGTFAQFRANLLTYLLADTSLTALIGQRLYFQELASLPAAEARYPLVTLRQTRGQQAAFVHQQFPLYIGAHSDISEAEAQTIMRIVRNRFLTSSPSGLGFVIFPDGTPTATYVATARLHHVFSRMRCHRFGL